MLGFNFEESINQICWFRGRGISLGNKQTSNEGNQSINQ